MGFEIFKLVDRIMVYIKDRYYKYIYSTKNPKTLLLLCGSFFLHMSSSSGHTLPSYIICLLTENPKKYTLIGFISTYYYVGVSLFVRHPSTHAHTPAYEKSKNYVLIGFEFRSQGTNYRLLTFYHSLVCAI